MLFNSYIFILCFLPLCVVGYFALNRLKSDIPGKLFLLGMSLWFYAYFHVSYLALILFSIGANYIFYILLRKKRAQAARKTVLAASLLVNLGLIFYFKYMDFFIGNLNAVFSANLPLLRIALPLGISFFTFQQISFIADAYKGETPDYSLLDYAGYVTFFPQLVAGPIVTHDQLIPQMCDPDRKKVNWDSLARGIYLFAIGLAKKVIVADTFGRVVDWGWVSLSGLNSTEAILVTVGYTFQIYFDFSGYCDMAMGIGKMLNIELPENFRSPYKALSIAEFWDRWHITLTKFFTKYVYIPLGGSRRGNLRTYRNIMIVFLASGLWHGASWNFVLWGAVHGLFLVIHRKFRSFFDRLHPALNWLITFGFVNAAWVLFRANTIRDAFRMYGILAQWNFGPISESIRTSFRLIEFEKLLNKTSIETAYPCVLTAVFYLGGLAIILGCRNAVEKTKEFKPTFGRVCTTVFLLVWSVFSLSGISTFLYFNF